LFRAYVAYSVTQESRQLEACCALLKPQFESGIDADEIFLSKDPLSYNKPVIYPQQNLVSQLAIAGARKATAKMPKWLTAYLLLALSILTVKAVEVQLVQVSVL
jgi:hypothetical protein